MLIVRMLFGACMVLSPCFALEVTVGPADVYVVSDRLDGQVHFQLDLWSAYRALYVPSNGIVVNVGWYDRLYSALFPAHYVHWSITNTPSLFVMRNPIEPEFCDDMYKHISILWPSNKLSIPRGFADTLAAGCLLSSGEKREYACARLFDFGGIGERIPQSFGSGWLPQGVCR